MPTPVYVCRECKAHRALVAELDCRDGVAVELVECQNICKGAVAGLECDGTMIWFRRLRGDKDRRSLAKLAARVGTAPVPKRLAGHIASKRIGRPPER